MIQNEIQILTELDHPNIVKIYEYFETDDKFYMVMELFKGKPLFKNIKLFRHNEEKCAEILYQLLRALNYIHQKGIIHMDIKAENILYLNGEIKVIDFGLSCFNSYKKKLNKMIGTKIYFAPEVMKHNYSYKCDIWSSGVLLFALLTAKMPFDGGSDQMIFNNIKNKKFNYNLKKDTRISWEAKEFVKLMLTIDPEKRPPANTLLSHKFLQKRPKLEFKGSSIRLLQNVNQFHLKNKLQRRIYYFFVHNMVLQKEHEKFGKVFRQLDKDGDGELSRSEIQEGFKILGKEESTEELDRIFEIIDVDGDGAISYTEFVAAAFEKTEFLKEDRISQFFQALDSKKVGAIRIDDIIQTIDPSEDINLKEMRALFKKYDVNQNNKIEFNEFKNMMKQLIPQAQRKKSKKAHKNGSSRNMKVGSQRNVSGRSKRRLSVRGTRRSLHNTGVRTPQRSERRITAG